MPLLCKTCAPLQQLVARMAILQVRPLLTRSWHGCRFMFGRERRLVDVPTDHPSCSKQHAVLQYRLVEAPDAYGVNQQVQRLISPVARPSAVSWMSLQVACKSLPAAPPACGCELNARSARRLPAGELHSLVSDMWLDKHSCCRYWGGPPASSYQSNNRSSAVPVSQATGQLCCMPALGSCSSRRLLASFFITRSDHQRLLLMMTTFTAHLPLSAT
jgi:hypothetical protein